MRFNLVDRLILLAPLLVPLFVSLGVVIGAIPSGSKFERIFASVLVVFLSIGIAVMLWRISSLSLPEPEKSLPETVLIARRKQIMLFVMFFIGAAFSFLFFGIGHMKGVFGIIFFMASIIAFALGAAYLRKSQDAQRKEITVNIFEPVYRSFIRRRGVLLVSQTVAGISAVLFYLYLGGDSYYSVGDLAGFLLFLGSFCFWYFMFGKYIHNMITTPKSS